MFESVIFTGQGGAFAMCAAGAPMLVNVSRSVRAADGRGRAHRALRLSRSLPPLQISSPEPLKRRTRHGVIRLVEQRVGFQREVVGSNLQLSKIIWPRFYHRKFCPRVAFSHLPCTKKQSHVRVMDHHRVKFHFPWGRGEKKIDSG